MAGQYRPQCSEFEVSVEIDKTDKANSRKMVFAVLDS